MSITEQMTTIVNFLNDIEEMSDEEYTNQNYWNVITSIPGGNWIQEFLIEPNITSPDRNTAISILKNFRQIQIVFCFTEAT